MKAKMRKIVVLIAVVVTKRQKDQRRYLLKWKKQERHLQTQILWRNRLLHRSKEQAMKLQITIKVTILLFIGKQKKRVSGVVLLKAPKGHKRRSQRRSLVHHPWRWIPSSLWIQQPQAGSHPHHFLSAFKLMQLQSQSGQRVHLILMPELCSDFGLTMSMLIEKVFSQPWPLSNLKLMSQTGRWNCETQSNRGNTKFSLRSCTASNSFFSSQLSS